MPSPRPLRSGIDYQLRYAAWRLILIATGHERLADASRFRVEWPLLDGAGKEVWSDFVIENAAGDVLEVVECREHAHYIPLDSLESFLRAVQQLREGPAAAALFRYATTSWIVKGGRDLTDEKTRRKIIKEIDPALVPIAETVRWDFRLDSKGGIFARAVEVLTGRVADARWTYASLYSRLGAMLGDRLPGADRHVGDALRDAQVVIFGSATERAKSLHSVAPEDAIDVGELRRRLTAAKVSPVAQLDIDVREALRRGLYEEEGVSTEDVFIEQNAQYVTGGRAPVTRGNGAVAAMLDWMSDVRELRAPEEPLLLLGQFGAGKSMAMRAFAGRLLERPLDVVPVPIPLRDLAKIADPKEFDKEVCNYVDGKWGIDVRKNKDVRYCLLCDGFDELNLYYSRDGAGWAEQVYARLTALARTRNISVVISSRPLQFLDATARGSVAERAPRIVIEDLTPEQVEQWCVLYRKAAKLDESFSWEFLERRNLTTVARTPIILYMIARIFATSPEMLQERSYTLGEIYRIFIDWTVKGAYKDDEEKHRVPTNYREILQEIAWHLSQAEGGMLPEADLLARIRERFGETIDGLPVNRNLLVAHMLQPAAGGGEGRLVEFKHQSFRDYLVAERILRVIFSVPHVDHAVEQLSGHPPTQATFSFLADAVNVMEGAEQQLLAVTEGADDIERYWTTRGSMAFFGVLMFFLRIRALERSRARRVSGVPSPDAHPFRKLLHFLAAFASLEDVDKSADLLLGNLHGVRFSGEELVSLDLRIPSVSGMELSTCNLRHLQLIAERVVNTRIYQCDLGHSDLRIEEATALTMSNVQLTHATIALGEPGKFCRDLRIYDSLLPFAHFSALFVEHGSISGNDWQGATAERSALVDCSLDEGAFRFFRSQEATLIDCGRFGASRWHEAPGWEEFLPSPFDEQELIRLATVAFGPPKSTRRVFKDTLRIHVTPDFTIDVVGELADPQRIRSGGRHLLIVRGIDAARPWRAAIRTLRDCEGLEVNVWALEDLVGAAFDAVGRTLKHVLPVDYWPEPVGHRFGELVRGRELSWGEYPGAPNHRINSLLVRSGRRLVVFTGDYRGRMAAQLPEEYVMFLSVVPGSAVDTTVSRPEEVLTSTVDVPEGNSLFPSILDSISSFCVNNGEFGLVIYDLAPSQILSLLRLFRDAKCHLVLSTPETNVFPLIEAEWNAWNDELEDDVPRISIVELRQAP